ncbi:MAG: hypothetical protein ACI9VT_001656 [Psychroserpens sp.]|jgi:hypothetical protein
MTPQGQTADKLNFIIDCYSLLGKSPKFLLSQGPNFFVVKYQLVT